MTILRRRRHRVNLEHRRKFLVLSDKPIILNATIKFSSSGVFIFSKELKYGTNSELKFSFKKYFEGRLEYRTLTIPFRFYDMTQDFEEFINKIEINDNFLKKEFSEIRHWGIM